jgi:hypothetical protein
LFCWTGKNAEGKCRGLKDVAQRVAKPLEIVSTVTTAVAVTAVGITVVCPPCGLVTLPVATLSEIAAVSRGIALATGLTSSFINCTEKVVSFDCAKGIVTTGIGVTAGGTIERRLGLLAASGLLKPSPEAIGHFGAGTFDLFAGGIYGVVDRIRK